MSRVKVSFFYFFLFFLGKNVKKKMFFLCQAVARVRV